MSGQNKVVIADAKGITIFYTDSKKRRFYSYDDNAPFLPYLKELNLFGDKYKGINYHEYQKELSTYQMRLYHDVLYGLNSYSMKQLREMSSAEKQEITAKHLACKKVLNKWKQQILSKAVDELLLSIFFKSTTIRQWVKRGKGFTDSTKDVDISFRELGIDKRQIIDRLIEKRILPQDFYYSQAA
jgi:hypothetical protein